ncbi:uncharacterized protein vgf [Aplochiton taeniatus]
MSRGRNASSVLTHLVPLVVLVAFLLHLSASSPILSPQRQDLNRPPASGLAAARDGERRRLREERATQEKGGEEEEEEEEEELFKDVDPKMLAAVLLEALNKPQGERRREGEEGRREQEKELRNETEGEEEEKEVGAADRVNRDRDNRQELELVMAAAAQGREARDREEEEERKKALEQEERLTEKVTSHTSSQTVPVKTQPGASTGGGGGGGRGGEEVPGKEVATKEEAGKGQTSTTTTATSQETQPQQEGGGEEEEEEEEQLSPEEVKNLETMLEEFQSISTANQKRERESRGWTDSNGIQSNLAMSKKKLKWQEETQKGMSFPAFKGGNFMDDFDNNNMDVGDNRVGPPQNNDMMEGDEAPEDEEEEEEEEEEVLSPEEEEARAKADQEELRRQAAEAQRAKMEEEKLADIASDMLLQYMVKQDGGGRKYRDQNRKKYSSLLASANAAEDKRSDEEQEAGGVEDDDIDPQTIDKLIEISSKLHLPADDVVDIISDVEKKKKKDLAPDALSPWQRPFFTPSSPSSPASNNNNAILGQVPTNRIGYMVPASKQSPPTSINPLKAWFKENVPAQPSSSTNQNPWLKPSSTNQDLWIKPQKPFRTAYPSYPSYTSYPSYYQQKPYLGYYPIYYPPPPKPKARYYSSKPQLTLDDILGNAVDYDYNFPPKPRFRPWVQPRFRKPPAGLRRNPFYSSSAASSPGYELPPPLSYSSRTFNPVLPKSRPPPRLAGVPRRRFYYPASLVGREGDYYAPMGMQQQQQRQRQKVDRNDEDLESYIQQVLMKQPGLFQ